MSYAVFLELYKKMSCNKKKITKDIQFNPVVPNVPFLYPLKTSENLTVL